MVYSLYWYAPMRLPESVADHPDEPFIVVAGLSGTGKTSVCENLAQMLRALGFPAMALSTGHLFRLIAMLARDLGASSGRDPRSYSAQELVQAAKCGGLSADGWRLTFAGQPLEMTALHDRSVSKMVAHWGNAPEVKQYILDFVRSYRHEFRGVLIVDDRNVCFDYPEAHLKFNLIAEPETVAGRLGKNIADVLARDQADRDSGAVPSSRIGWTVATDTDAIDQVTYWLFSWLFRNFKSFLTTPLAPPIITGP